MSAFSKQQAFYDFLIGPQVGMDRKNIRAWAEAGRMEFLDSSADKRYKIFYTAFFVFEKLNQNNNYSNQLLILASLWLKLNDFYRDQNKLAPPSFATDYLNSGEYALELTIPFCEEFDLVPTDENDPQTLFRQDGTNYAPKMLECIEIDEYSGEIFTQLSVDAVHEGRM